MQTVLLTWCERCNSGSAQFCSLVKKINWPQRVNPLSSGSSSVVFWAANLKAEPSFPNWASERCGGHVTEAAAVTENALRFLRRRFRSSAHKSAPYRKPTVQTDCTDSRDEGDLTFSAEFHKFLGKSLVKLTEFGLLCFSTRQPSLIKDGREERNDEVKTDCSSVAGKEK